MRRNIAAPEDGRSPGTSLATKGYDPQFGARPLKRAIQEHLLDPLATKLLAGEFKPGTRLRLAQRRRTDVCQKINCGILSIISTLVSPVRLQFIGLAVIGGGAFRVALGFLRIAAIAVGAIIIGFEFDGLGVVRNGVVPIGFALVGIAAITVSALVIGLEFEGFGVIRDGAVPIVDALFGIAAVTVGVCISGLSPMALV